MRTMEIIKTVLPLSEDIYREWEAGTLDDSTLGVIKDMLRKEAAKTIAAELGSAPVTGESEIKGYAEYDDELGRPLPSPRFYLVMHSYVEADEKAG